MDIVRSTARDVWPVAKFFWLTVIIGALINYGATVLAMPVKDLAKGFSNSTIGWLLLGPYQILTISTLTILLTITIVASIITPRDKSVETDTAKSQP